MKFLITLSLILFTLVLFSGCGIDSDGDGEPDVSDQCPLDPNKTNPGECGCNVSEGSCSNSQDTDGDGILDQNDHCPQDPAKSEPGECGCGVPEGTCDTNTVLSSDTILVPPDNKGPIVATIAGYNWDNGKYPDAKHELPIYQNMDRDSDDYWNYLVDELLLGRVDAVFFHGRGCYGATSGTDGAGRMCPRLLSKMVKAAKRAGVENIIRVGMWDDTGAYDNTVKHNEGADRLDLSNKSHWKYVWDHNMKIFFDTVPKNMWFLMDGKPVIAFWGLHDTIFKNQRNNASRLLSWLKSNFKNRYGVEPIFILQNNWFTQDPSITSDLAAGMHNWFKPKHDDKDSIYSMASYNGKKWSVILPGFRNGGSNGPGCGVSCREVTRRDGATYDDAMKKVTGADFILLEAWTNCTESSGVYRSNDWRYPTHYINLTRRYSDPEPETLRFQAEGADKFYDKSGSNLGGEYANRSLDVGRFNDNTGWYVGWTESGEWIQYNSVELGCGTYRFTARVATDRSGNKIRLAIGGLPQVEVSNNGSLSEYQLVHLGEVHLEAGTYNLRVVMESAERLNIDWFFVKRSQHCE